MRRLTLVVTWMTVTALATALTWTAVARLAPGGGRSSRPLSGNAVDAALRLGAATSAPPSSGQGGGEPGALSSAGTTPGGGLPGGGAPSAPGPTAPAHAPASPPPTSAPPATTAAPTRPTAPASGPAPSAPSGSSGASGSSSGSGSGGPTPSTTPSTTPPANRSAVVESTGGVATVSCSGSTITLVSSSPRNGYSQEVEDAGPEEVKVRYRSSTHESEIQVVCRSGQPAAQTDESGRD